MNKKAQFFLVFAVIIGVLMISIVTLTNNAEVNNKNAEELFNAKCENYRDEVFRTSEYAIANENKSEEYGLIYNFTSVFVKEMNQTFNFEMIFLYGDETNVTVVNYFDNVLNAANEFGPTVNVQSSPNNVNYTSGQNITVSGTDFTETYNFNKDTSFYFYMRAHKDKDVYACE